jgi:hypothetical protein
MTRAILCSEVGTEFPGKVRQLSMARALALSGGPFDAPDWPEKNLHTQLAAAQAAGLSAVVASGTQWVGYTVGLLVELCGSAWFENGELDIRITRSVRIGETLQPKAILEAREAGDGGVKVRFGVRCDNADGDHVLIGTATCILPASSDHQNTSATCDA